MHWFLSDTSKIILRVKENKLYFFRFTLQPFRNAYSMLYQVAASFLYKKLIELPT